MLFVLISEKNTEQMVNNAETIILQQRHATVLSVLYSIFYLTRDTFILNSTKSKKLLAPYQNKIS